MPEISGGKNKSQKFLAADLLPKVAIPPCRLFIFLINRSGLDFDLE
eukprot:UN09390